MSAPLEQLLAIERRLRALAPRARGERRALVLAALGDLAVLHGYAREPGAARAIAVTIGAMSTLAALEEAPRARGRPRGQPFRRKVSDDQLRAARAQAATLACMAALLGLSTSAISRRLARLQSESADVCAQ